ncbi:hypothetical protein BGX38DRAFT_1215014 [Terfezia claveryi]|nr:hypothetical protein BGX38DRAFT_1215014 [Terfezia claveryi]
MQFFKAFNWLCLFGASVLVQSSEGITTDVSVLPTAAMTAIGTRPIFPGDKRDIFYRWTRSTQVQASPTSTSMKSKYRRPTSSCEPTVMLNGKHTKTIESCRSTKLPKYRKTIANQATTRRNLIKPFPTLLSNRNVDASDPPDCVQACAENASAFTNCVEESKDCICVDNQFQKILYHCLKSICEPEMLSYAVQVVIEECSPYLPIDEKGEAIMFHDIKVHQQGELHQLYARNILGSGLASGARPNGPTALAFPKEVVEGNNVEVVVTTIVTEYVGEALYSGATAGLEGKASEGKITHGHRRLRRTKHHHM